MSYSFDTYKKNDLLLIYTFTLCKNVFNLLQQQYKHNDEAVPLQMDREAENGMKGSRNNLKTAGSFLMKLATWIDSRVEIMHTLLLCLPNINFGCYGNLKLPMVYNGKMRILQKLQKYMFFSHETCYMDR